MACAAVVFAVSCVSTRWAAKTLGERGTAAEREFDRVARAFLDAYLRANPVFGTANGHHDRDHLLGDFSAAALASTVEAYRKHRAAIAAIDPSDLSPDVALDRVVVKNAIDLAVFDLTEARRPESDPFFYLEILGFGALQLVEGTDGSGRSARFEALAGRMERIPEFLETARTNLQNPPAVRTSLALENLSAVTDLYRSIESQAARVPLPPELRDRLSKAQTEALRALARWKLWLSHDGFARSKGDWRLGAAGFAKRLSIMLGADVRPDELVAAAYGEVARRRAAVHRVGARAHETLFPLHRHAETGEELASVMVSEVLREGSRRQTPARSVFDRTQFQLGLLREFITAHRIVTLPPSADGLRVRPAPGFVDGLSAAFFSATSDAGGPTLWIAPDAAGPGLPPREPSDCELQVIAIHEGYPGHYVQWWHAQQSAGGSLWRRIFPNAAFSEGWAAFAEDLMLDSGFGAGDESCLLLAQKAGLDSALNLILDERFHRGGDDDATLDMWAMELLTRDGFFYEHEARRKLRRVRLGGTQLSTYFAGRLFLEKAFLKWRERGGTGRPAAGFADNLLRLGAIPPAVVEMSLCDSK